MVGEQLEMTVVIRRCQSVCLDVVDCRSVSERLKGMKSPST